MNRFASPLTVLESIPLTTSNALPMIDLVIEQMGLLESGSTPSLASLGPCGYVICAGGRYARYGYATCRWIREVLKDDAAIEVWAGSNEPLGVECCEGHITHRQADTPGGWPLKARAVLKSSFEKVILLDADCIPLVKAEYLWANPCLASGALFFPDIGNHRKSDWAYQALKLRPGDMPEMEAGQLAIDRCRHSKAVLLTDYFNRRPEFFYHHNHGDKDLWALAFARLKIPFTTGAPCTDEGWGLRHYLPDGTRYCDHLIRVKGGEKYADARYQGYLEEYDRLFPA